VLRDREPVSVSEFEAQLLRISEACRRWCGRQVAFVTTPPIHPGRFAAAWNGRSSGMGRAGGALLNGGLAHDHSSASDAAFSLNRAITQYNQGAMNLLSELNIMVIRLHDALEPYLDECIAEDGVSLSPAGVERAAAVVATGILGVV
jgi:hypothetical protein